jgi:hypothetical protein
MAQALPFKSFHQQIWETILAFRRTLQFHLGAVGSVKEKHPIPTLSPIPLPEGFPSTLLSPACVSHKNSGRYRFFFAKNGNPSRGVCIRNTTAVTGLGAIAVFGGELCSFARQEASVSVHSGKLAVGYPPLPPPIPSLQAAEHAPTPLLRAESGS